MSRFQQQIIRRANKQKGTTYTKKKTANRKCLWNGLDVGLTDKDFLNYYKYIQITKGNHT